MKKFLLFALVAVVSLFTLDDTDWQEMVDLHNAVHFEHALKPLDWSTKTPTALKERVNNFLCRDFYQKYNIKEDSV